MPKMSKGDTFNSLELNYNKTLRLVITFYNSKRFICLSYRFRQTEILNYSNVHQDVED